MTHHLTIVTHHPTIVTNPTTPPHHAPHYLRYKNNSDRFGNIEGALVAHPRQGLDNDAAEPEGI